MVKKVIKKTRKKKATTEIEEISDDLGTAIAVKALYDSEGGQLLVEGLVNDILGAIDTMITGTSELSHIGYVTLASRIKERVDLLRVLTNAKANKEVLEDILAEAIKKEKENTNEATIGT